MICPIFLHHGDNLFHALLDLVDLRVDFLDEIVLEFGQFFDAFALLAKLCQQGILLGGKPVDPSKADIPAGAADQGPQEIEGALIHIGSDNGQLHAALDNAGADGVAGQSSSIMNI